MFNEGSRGRKRSTGSTACSLLLIPPPLFFSCSVLIVCRFFFFSFFFSLSLFFYLFLFFLFLLEQVNDRFILAKLVLPPVQEFAKYGQPVFQPPDITAPEDLARIPRGTCVEIIVKLRHGGTSKLRYKKVRRRDCNSSGLLDRAHTCVFYSSLSWLFK